jgi:hypothetical protein
VLEDGETVHFCFRKLTLAIAHKTKYEGKQDKTKNQLGGCSGSREDEGMYSFEIFRR